MIANGKIETLETRNLNNDICSILFRDMNRCFISFSSFFFFLFQKKKTGVAQKMSHLFTALHDLNSGKT